MVLSQKVAIPWPVEWMVALSACTRLLQTGRFRRAASLHRGFPVRDRNLCKYFGEIFKNGRTFHKARLCRLLSHRFTLAEAIHPLSLYVDRPRSYRQVDIQSRIKEPRERAARTLSIILLAIGWKNCRFASHVFFANSGLTLLIALKPGLQNFILPWTPLFGSVNHSAASFT
jgi:hypothetical protein